MSWVVTRTGVSGFGVGWRGEEVMGRLCRGYGRVGLVMLRSIKLCSWPGGKDCVSVAKLNK